MRLVYSWFGIPCHPRQDLNIFGSYLIQRARERWRANMEREQRSVPSRKHQWEDSIHSPVTTQKKQKRGGTTASKRGGRGAKRYNNDALAKRMQQDLERGITRVFITNIAKAAVEAEYPSSPSSSLLQYSRQCSPLSPELPESAQTQRKSVSLTPPPILPPYTAPTQGPAPDSSSSDDELEKLDRIWVQLKFQNNRKSLGAPKERHLALNGDWFDFRQTLKPFWLAKFPEVTLQDFWKRVKIEYAWVTSAKKNSKQGSFPYTSLDDSEDYESLQNIIRSTVRSKRDQMCLMLNIALPADKKEGNVSDVKLVLSDDDCRSVSLIASSNN